MSIAASFNLANAWSIIRPPILIYAGLSFTCDFLLFIPKGERLIQGIADIANFYFGSLSNNISIKKAYNHFCSDNIPEYQINLDYDIRHITKPEILSELRTNIFRYLRGRNLLNDHSLKDKESYLEVVKYLFYSAALNSKFIDFSAIVRTSYYFFQYGYKHAEDLLLHTVDDAFYSKNNCINKLDYSDFSLFLSKIIQYMHCPDKPNLDCTNPNEVIKHYILSTNLQVKESQIQTKIQLFDLAIRTLEDTNKYISYLNTKPLLLKSPAILYLYADNFFYEQGISSEALRILQKLRKYNWNVFAAKINHFNGLCSAINHFSSKMIPKYIILSAHGNSKGFSFRGQLHTRYEISKSLVNNCFSSLKNASTIQFILNSCEGASIASYHNDDGENHAISKMNNHDFITMLLKNANVSANVHAYENIGSLSVKSIRTLNNYELIFSFLESKKIEGAKTHTPIIGKTITQSTKDPLCINEVFKSSIGDAKILSSAHCGSKIHSSRLEAEALNSLNIKTRELFVKIYKKFFKNSTEKAILESEKNFFKNLERACKKKLAIYHPDKQQQLNGKDFIQLTRFCQINLEKAYEAFKILQLYYNMTIDKLD